MPTQLPEPLDRALRLVRVDFAPAHRQPSAVRVAAATALALAGSLAADAVLVAAGKAAFPTTQHYQHFQPSDYGKLTIIGVLIACVAWPVVTRISSAPRWLFFRQAIAVTLVLLLPDLYILYAGQPVTAVFVLMLMHLAIGVVTYNCLVRVAPVKEGTTAGRHDRAAGPDDEYYAPARYTLEDRYTEQDQRHGERDFGRQQDQYGRSQQDRYSLRNQ